MNSFKINFLLLSALIVASLTGCYTQVATTDPEPYSTTIYKQDKETSDYYSEDGELLDSSYYSDVDPESDETVIVNEYYTYPYGYNDYYPYISFGIGFSWGWGWGSYYSYWPYYPYYGGYWGCGWYYPSYCYYPSYYYYDPYYCYGGYYPYYDYGYGYGYYPRDEYVARIRNNSGGRNNPEIHRDPLVTSTNGSIDRNRDDINLGRDLIVERNTISDRTKGIDNRTGDITREVVGVNDKDRIKNNTRNDIVSSELTGISNIRKDKKSGLDRELTTKKSLGINTRKDVSRENIKSNNLNSITDKINNSNRIGQETKKLFNKNNSTQYNKKNNVRTNNDSKKTDVNNQKNYQTTKKDNNTRTYSPPKQNNNSPRTYSPPSGNNNTTRSYSPPSGNNSPRSYSPPTRNSGSNNSGNRKR